MGGYVEGPERRLVHKLVGKGGGGGGLAGVDEVVGAGWRVRGCSPARPLPTPSTRLQAANVGDSAALWIDPDSGQALEMTEDHRLTNPRERQRLQDMGIQVCPGMYMRDARVWVQVYARRSFVFVQ